MKSWISSTTSDEDKQGSGAAVAEPGQSGTATPPLKMVRPDGGVGPTSIKKSICTGVFASIVVLVVMGLLLTGLVTLLERKLLAWKATTGLGRRPSAGASRRRTCGSIPEGMMTT